MKTVLVVVLCAFMAQSTADIAHLKAKAKLLGRLTGKHHKRGVLSSVPTFKLGHDIPHVTHSVLKPIVVNYPPTASVTAVKVPLVHPFIHRHHLHKVPLHHAHKVHTNTVVVPNPDQHFHHHHHHVAPRPVVPLLPAPLPPTPVVPVAQPTVIHPVPAPPPPVFVHPAPVARPVFPFAPVVPQHHVHLPRPILPAPPAPIPLQPAAVVSSPVFPARPQYIIRPGNAVQTSYFATYPRYPFVNLPTPFAPFAAPLPASIAPAPVQVHHPQAPHFHLLAQAAQPGIIEHQTPIAVEPTPTLLHSTQHAHHLHLQPTQPVPLDHNGWSPVHAHSDLTPTHHPEPHFPHEHHFTQEEAPQVYEQHTEEQLHDYHHQLQHHIQQQIDQAQYEQHLNNQGNQEYGVPQQISHEYGQPQQDYPQQDYPQQVHDYTQQHYNEHSQQEYGLPQQPGQEYGVPQGVEGRSSEGDDDSQDTAQRYHNHIPLGLQPPIDRPLENFQ